MSGAADVENPVRVNVPACTCNCVSQVPSGSPILFIDDVDVQSREGVKPGDAAASDMERLTVAVDVSGYLPRDAQR